MSASIGERFVNKQVIAPQSVAEYVEQNFGKNHIHILGNFEGPDEPVLVQADNWQEIKQNLDWMSVPSNQPNLSGPSLSPSRMSVKKILKETGEEELIAVGEIEETVENTVLSLNSGNPKTLQGINKNKITVISTSAKDQLSESSVTQSVTQLKSNTSSPELSRLQPNEAVGLKLRVPQVSHREELELEEKLHAQENISDLSPSTTNTLNLSSSTAKGSTKALDLKNQPSNMLALEPEEDLVVYTEDLPAENLNAEPVMQKIPVYSSQQGDSGKAFQAVKSLYDLEAKSAAGAPMMAVWNNPVTNQCNFAFVPVPQVAPITRSVPSCTVVKSHLKSRAVMKYEGGKLGSSNGPAVVKISPSGKLSARPTYCLGGRGVSRKAHTQGMQNVISGASIASAYISASKGKPSNLQLPGARSKVNLQSMHKELALAESSLKEWNVENEPRLRNQERGEHLNTALALKAKGLAELAAARKDVENLQEEGYSSVTINFPKYSPTPGGFFSELASDLHHTVETGRALRLQRQGTRDLDYSASLANNA